MPRSSSLLSGFLLVIFSIFLVSSVFAMGEIPSKTTTTTVVSSASPIGRHPRSTPSARFVHKDVEPPAFTPTYAHEVEDLKIGLDVEEGKKVRLNWKNPSDKNFAGIVIIVRSDRYPENVLDHEGDGKALINLMGMPSENQSYTASLYFPKWMKIIIRDPNQYYLVVAYDKNGNYSKGVKGILMGMIL